MTNQMRFPKKKWSEPTESPSKRSVVPEEYLQSFTNDYLQLRRIRYFRIEDRFFKWINGSHVVPTWVKKFVNGMFGGYPDNTCMIRVCDGYSLTMHLELKTEDSKGRAVGRTHGKQKNNAKAQGWIIARNQSDIQRAIDKFENDAVRLGHIFGQYSISELYTNIFGKKNTG